MTLYSILRLQLTILALAVFGTALQAADPLEKLPDYWIPNFDKEVNTDARQARFVGYLEGRLNVDIPQWWRNEGLYEYSNIKPNENVSIYGSHPKDSLELNGDVFAVEGVSPRVSEFKVHRTNNGNDIWSITQDDIPSQAGGSGGSGGIAFGRDYAIRTSGDVIYVFGRKADLRFIVAYSVSNGSKLGSFAYRADSISDIKLH